MEALTSHGFRTFLAEESSRNTNTGALFSSSKPIRILHAPKKKKVGSGCSIFLELKPIRSSSLSQPAPEADDAESVHSQVQTAYQSKTVHVKFVLHQECLFGQQFLLVGEGPFMGLWDPSNAIPLEWSDDHVWRAELDIQIGESVQYKFILRGLSGEIKWQPGPDRILKTWETTNTIVVSEDWEHAVNQKITEEPSESKIGNNDKSVIDENQMSMIETEERFAYESLTRSMNDEEKKPVSAKAEIINDGQFADTSSIASVKAPHDCDTSQQLVGEQEEPKILEEDTPSNDGELFEESDSQSTADILRNDVRWGGKTMHQFLLDLGSNLKPPLD